MNPSTSYRDLFEFMNRLAWTGVGTVALNYPTSNDPMQLMRSLDEQIRYLQERDKLLTAFVYDAQRLAGHNGTIKPLKTNSLTVR